MRPTEKLQRQGQSLWLDNITRKMLDSGQLARYVEQYSVTGLTSNPSIFDKAIESGDYEAEIHDKAAHGVTGEAPFFELAIEDLRRAADLFLPSTSAPTGWTAGGRSRCRRCSRTTRAARSLRPRCSTSEPVARTSAVVTATRRQRRRRSEPWTSA